MKIRSLFLSLLFLSFNLIAEDIDLSLKLDGVHYIKDGAQTKPAVFIGDSFNLKVITSSSKSSNSEPTKPDGIVNFSIESVSSRSNVSVINSVVKSEKTKSYTLFPKKEGVFNIGPSRMEHEGKSYKSNILTLLVLAQSDKNKYKITTNNNSRDATSGNIEYEVNCRLITNKTEAFVGEQIKVNFFIFARGDYLELDGIKLPEFDNCSVESDEKFKEFQKNIEGKDFKVYEKEFLIYPNKPGAINIEPARVSYKVRNKIRSRSFGFFDDDMFPFRGFGAERKLSASNPIFIKVSDLPVKDGVDGVGVIKRFEAKVDKKNVLVNEPIKLVLELEGEFNFENVIFNNLDLPEVFKSYESKVESDKNSKTKKFEFVLQASNSGTLDIPSQTFNYFDTYEKKQKTISTKPIQIVSSLPSGQKSVSYQTEDPAYAQGYGGQDVEHAKKNTDINFIEEDGPIQYRRSFHLAFWFFLIFVFLAPFIVFMNKIQIYCVGFLKSKFPGKRDIFNEYKKKLISFVDDKKPAELYNLFINLFVEISGKSLGTVNVEWIEKFLISNGFGKKQAEDFVLYLHECAQCSFVGDQKLTYEVFKKLKNEGIDWLSLIIKTVR